VAKRTTTWRTRVTMVLGFVVAYTCALFVVTPALQNHFGDWLVASFTVYLLVRLIATAVAESWEAQAQKTLQAAADANARAATDWQHKVERQARVHGEEEDAPDGEDRS